MPIVEAVGTAKGRKQCPVCNGHLLRPDALDRHHWRCKDCGRVFIDTQGTLVEHEA